MAKCEFDESNANWSGGAGKEGEYVERSSTRKISRHNEGSKSISSGNKSMEGAMGAVRVFFASKPISEKNH